jgi:hypothetical protein
MSMIDEAEIKRKTVGPTPETINLIKSCQVHDDNYARPIVSEAVAMSVSNMPMIGDDDYVRRLAGNGSSLAYVQCNDESKHAYLKPITSSELTQPPYATAAQEIHATHQAIEQTKQVTQQQVAQSTKAPVVKARTIQEQRQIITSFLKLKEDTLNPDNVLVKELGTTIGTLEKYATTDQMTEWARLRQICFSKPRFTQSTQSSVNNTPTSLERNINKRIMEA